MKHLQSFVAVALCVIFAMNITSCSKDDSDEPEKPKVEKRMKSLDKTSFVYTDGKITQTIWDGRENYSIKYTESSIKIGDDTYYLNNGLVSKYIKSDGWYQVFTYEDGRIKTWKKYYDDGTLEEDITFEWKDGVIIRQTEYDRSEDSYDYGQMKLFCDYEYSYTNDPDYGGAIACFQSNSLFYDYLPEALIIQGYFGKWPKYLVASTIDVSPDRFEPDYYTWTLDSDGYPIKVSDDYNVNFSWKNVK